MIFSEKLRILKIAILSFFIIFAFTGDLKSQEIKKIQTYRNNLLIKDYSKLKLFKVVKVRVLVDQSEYRGRCPHKFTFTGEITTNSGGTVKYKWLRSDGALSPEKTVIFRKAGKKLVTTTWTLGAAGRQYRNMWEAIQVTSPNTITSGRAVFNLRCTLVAQIAYNLISGNINGGASGNLIRNRRVRVELYRGASRITFRDLTLNSSGQANYTFSGAFLTPGSYRVQVIKLPTAPGNPNTLNVCFNGTNPSQRNYTFGSTRQHYTNQNFIINFSIAWNRYGFCW